MKVDTAFARYEGDREGGRPLAMEEALNILLHEMTSHAHKLIWTECRQERPDVINEALIRALKGLPRFRGTSKFSTWFHRIVLNTLRRALKRENNIARREVPLEKAGDLVSHHAGEVESLDIKAVLGENDSDFFNRHEDGWNVFELGARYNLSPAGVRSRWHRIKEKLKQVMLKSST